MNKIDELVTSTHKFKTYELNNGLIRVKGELLPNEKEFLRLRKKKFESTQANHALIADLIDVE